MATQDDLSCNPNRSGRVPPPSPPSEFTSADIAAAETLILMAYSTPFDPKISLHPSSTSTVQTTTTTLPLSGAKRHREPSTSSSHECNECGKVFDSHQALGGHKTSHRVKDRVVAAATTSPTGKMHVCPKCNMGFTTGPALGGHMRKHSEEVPSPPRKKIIWRFRIRAGGGGGGGESTNGGASSSNETDLSEKASHQTCLL